MMRALLLLLAVLLASCASSPPRAVDTPGGGRYYLAATPAERYYVYGHHDPLNQGWGINTWWSSGYYGYYSPYFYPHRFVVHYGWPRYGGFGHPGYYHPWRPPGYHPHAPGAPPAAPVAPPPPVAIRPPLPDPPLDEPVRARRWDERVLRPETPPGLAPAHRSRALSTPAATAYPVAPRVGRPAPSPDYRVSAPRSISRAAPVSTPRAAPVAPPARHISRGSDRAPVQHDK